MGYGVWLLKGGPGELEGWDGFVLYPSGIDRIEELKQNPCSLGILYRALCVLSRCLVGNHYVLWTDEAQSVIGDNGSTQIYTA